MTRSKSDFPATPVPWPREPPFTISLMLKSGSLKFFLRIFFIDKIISHHQSKLTSMVVTKVSTTLDTFAIAIFQTLDAAKELTSRLFDEVEADLPTGAYIRPL